MMRSADKLIVLPQDVQTTAGGKQDSVYLTP
jgi:hypothetical protein